MSIISIGFLMGMFGSLHCALMCGPLMLSLPARQSNNLFRALQLLLYQLGRTLSYGFLGVIVGVLGNSIAFFANQKKLSIIVGLLLVIITLIYLSGKFKTGFSKFQLALTKPLSKLMGKVYNMPVWGFFAGALNGLIPCGMVYLALASALNFGSVTQATAFMLVFGLGTTPVMFIVSLGGIYFRRYLKFNPNKLLPWFTFALGVLLIVRSINFGSAVSHDHSAANAHVTECR